jgi:hypothetical protein
MILLPRGKKLFQVVIKQHIKYFKSVHSSAFGKLTRNWRSASRLLPSRSHASHAHHAIQTTALVNHSATPAFPAAHSAIVPASALGLS